MKIRAFTYPALSALVLALAACGSDNDDAPINEPNPPVAQSIESVAFLGRYVAGQFEQSAAEIPAYDPITKRVFVVNAQSGQVDVLDLSDPAAPRKINTLAADAILAGSEINSIAIQNGLLAAAIQPSDKTLPGRAALYDTSTLELLSHIPVGALPDMLTFTPDGKTLLVANEGEADSRHETGLGQVYVDPEGSVSVIDVSDRKNLSARTASFTPFNGQRAALIKQGVRLPDPRATVAQDLEPEYIAVSEDGKTAWISLQENNALAKLDVAAATITDILPLGYKDHGADGNGLDVSDTDGKIDIRTWPGVKGIYMPDAIAAYNVDGKTYIVTANEGDSRAWGEEQVSYLGYGRDTSNDDWNLIVPAPNAAAPELRHAPGFIDEIRVKHLVHHNGFDRRANPDDLDMPPHLRALAFGGLLDPDVFSYCGATATRAGDCREDDSLGRLTVTWTMGYKTNADGTPALVDGRLIYENLYAYGGRSFSIFDEDGKLVWDSGDQFEQHLAQVNPDWFNSDHAERNFDNRSDNKGPEPEGVTLGKISGKTYAFIGLERIGGVMVYDVSKPDAPAFVTYVNSRDFSVDTDAVDQDANPSAAGDLGPEGLVFISAEDSPNGKPLLVVGNEVSGTTAVYEIKLKDDEV